MDRQEKDPRTARLHSLMAEHQLRIKDVAELLDRSQATVACWRVGRSRIIPALALDALEKRIAERTAVAGGDGQ